MNEVKLNFKENEKFLAGFPYGREVYKKQLRNVIDYSDRFAIIFPDHVERLSDSFIGGFFSEIIKNVGYSNFSRQVLIGSGNIEVRKSIINYIEDGILSEKNAIKSRMKDKQSYPVGHCKDF